MSRTITVSIYCLLFFQSIIAQRDVDRWNLHASQVEIIRDQYGIPHIYGDSDADAVFGLMYAQCEDDFYRVELNYIEKLGRLAELHGEQDVYRDLYTRMIIDTTEAKKDYAKSPKWLKTLLNAFADGINYYLHSHPTVKPALLTHFEPWYPLLWTDGSIGAINTADVDARDLQNLYEGKHISKIKTIQESTGSNGFAVGPSKSINGHAMLYINPHVTFYFRPEVHMASKQGLNVYGAVTWGQFFIYQGFNEHCGWMHTSCNVDVADVYMEKTSTKNGRRYYQLDGKLKPFKEKKQTIFYKDGTHTGSKSFPVYFNHRGPVMAIRNDQWATVRSYNRSLNGLIQCWMRNKATGLQDYIKVMDLRGNISNNTVYADKDGHIAYWHGNFIPKRDPSVNWSIPVDGSLKKLDWQGVHSVSETVHSIDPKTAWLQNCNSTPFSVAGPSSPAKNSYPKYMAPDGENFRGIHAVRILNASGKLDIHSLAEVGYDRRLPAFEILVPALLKAYTEYSYGGDNEFIHLEPAIQLLREWDYKVDTNSIATTLAIEWAQLLQSELQKVYIDEGEDDQVIRVQTFAAKASHHELLRPFSNMLSFLFEMYGSWQVPWGLINRFQRLNGDVIQKPKDELPSIAIPFASSAWGMLPSYNSRRFEGTKKRYGVSGNSFICAVEFGPRVKAISLLAGGQNRNPASPHFWDQAQMYAEGKFKDVLFYKEDVEKNVSRRYRPGKSE